MQIWNQSWKSNKTKFNYSKPLISSDLTLFLTGSGITLLDGGGAIMARMDSSHPEAVCRHPKAQKWLPSNFFDLWLSIDTKNSILWAVVLANPAVKYNGKKWKFSCKNMSKFKIFWYMRVIYIKRKLRTCTIQIQKEKVWFFEKKIFFEIFDFFSKGGTLWCQNSNFFFQFFKIS